MSGRRTLAVARRVVEQFRRDRRTIALVVVVPLVILSLIGYLFGPSTSTSRQPVAVVNEDAGPLGKVLSDALAGTTSLDARIVDAERAEAALRAGEVNATLTFPRTFTADALGSRRIALRVRLEGSDLFANGNTVAAIQKAAGESLAAALASSPLGGTGAGIALDVSYLHGGADWGVLDYLAPVYIPFLAFFFIFLLTTVAFLRERASGTLERLLASPLRRLELVAGYVLGLGAFALVQTVIVVLFTLYVLGLKYHGTVGAIFVVEIVLLLGTVNLGLFLSAFARNEFQAVQFIPLVVLPQFLLCGLLVPVADLPDLLRPLAWALPLTYAAEASRAVMVKGVGLADPIVLRDLGALAVFATVAAFAATRTIRRDLG